MNWNPIRRSPLKKRAREHKESMPWRRPKVRLNGREMGELRQNAFARSAGQCENAITANGRRCTAQIYWATFHLSHMQSRGRGGSDVLENVLCCCIACHDDDTQNRRKLVPHKDWIANV
jgi:hypothetical protein